MKTTFKVEGFAELKQALDELPKATATNVQRRALIDAAQPIMSAARALAPRLRGHLKASHAVGTKLSGRQARLHRKQSKVEVFVGPGALAQATQQEFGNANHPAQPFMRPAWDANKLRALAIIKEALAREIEKARARIAKKAERLARQMKQGT